VRFKSENEPLLLMGGGLLPKPAPALSERAEMRFHLRAFLVATAVLLTIPGTTRAASPARENRCAFIGIINFAGFSTSPGTRTNTTTFTSPEIAAPIEWDELIVSWNVSPGVRLKVEARAIFPSHATRYYTMGLWSEDPAQFPRESVRGQRDEDGSVKTDTLVLSNVTRRVQLRITAGGAGDQEMLKFVGLSFCNSTVPATVLEPNRAAWGKSSRSRSVARASMRAAAAGAAPPRSRWFWRIGADNCSGLSWTALCPRRPRP